MSWPPWCVTRRRWRLSTTCAPVLKILDDYQVRSFHLGRSWHASESQLLHRRHLQGFTYGLGFRCSAAAVMTAWCKTLAAIWRRPAFRWGRAWPGRAAAAGEKDRRLVLAGPPGLRDRSKGKGASGRRRAAPGRPGGQLRSDFQCVGLAGTESGRAAAPGQRDR